MDRSDVNSLLLYFISPAQYSAAADAKQSIDITYKYLYNRFVCVIQASIEELRKNVGG